MNEEIDREKMDQIKELTISKAEEFLYDDTQNSRAKQVEEIVRQVAKMYGI